jgi:electron transport complex protein RnfB
VAALTGKEAGSVEDTVPVVLCSRVQGKVHKKYNYVGDGSCSGANLVLGGPSECEYGCLGFGECAKACPVEAITMVDDFPVIDEDQCIRCGLCAKTCPKGIIQMVPKNARVLIRCSTKDPGKVTQAICDVGCIHCKACIKKCPAKAISVGDGKVTIDTKKCVAYGPACKEVCVEACNKVHILQPLRHTKRQAEPQKAAAA